MGVNHWYLRDLKSVLNDSPLRPNLHPCVVILYTCDFVTCDLKMHSTRPNFPLCVVMAQELADTESVSMLVNMNTFWARYQEVAWLCISFDCVQHTKAWNTIPEPWHNSVFTASTCLYSSIWDTMLWFRLRYLAGFWQSWISRFPQRVQEHTACLFLISQWLSRNFW